MSLWQVLQLQPWAFRSGFNGLSCTKDLARWVVGVASRIRYSKANADGAKSSEGRLSQGWVTQVSAGDWVTFRISGTGGEKLVCRVAPPLWRSQLSPPGGHPLVSFGKHCKSLSRHYAAQLAAHSCSACKNAVLTGDAGMKLITRTSGRLTSWAAHAAAPRVHLPDNTPPFALKQPTPSPQLFEFVKQEPPSLLLLLRGGGGGGLERSGTLSS